MKKAIDKNWVQGPRLLASGPIISPTNGQFGKLAYLHKSLPVKNALVSYVETGLRYEIHDGDSQGAYAGKISV